MLHTKKMAFVGSGVMGEAMIKGLLTQNLTAPDCIMWAFGLSLSRCPCMPPLLAIRCGSVAANR